MSVQIQLRRGTAAAWTAAATVLAAGEVGVETDTGKIKIGDGVTAWAGLAYLSGGGTEVAGPDADITVDAAGAAGTPGTRARSQHGHKVVSVDAPSGANVTIDAAPTAAATGSLARAGHGHRLNTYSSTPASPTVAGSAGTSGDAPARGSHVHPIPVPTVNIYTTGSGNWSKPAGARYVKVRVVGGGGGGGGSASNVSGNRSDAGGGGAGGYSEKWFAASALASTEPYQVGAAGTAGAAGANTGGTGGTSYFGAVGYRVQGNGGVGGSGAATASGAAAVAGGAGGTATGGDLNITGQDGTMGLNTNGSGSFGGGGGTCPLGAGAASIPQATNTPGQAPNSGYGGGGSGSANAASSSAQAGGAGAAGVVIVETYF